MPVLLNLSTEADLAVSGSEDPLFMEEGERGRGGGERRDSSWYRHWF